MHTPKNVVAVQITSSKQVCLHHRPDYTLYNTILIFTLYLWYLAFQKSSWRRI